VFEVYKLGISLVRDSSKDGIIEKKFYNQVNCPGGRFGLGGDSL